MSDRPIQVGDLVQIVRGTRCCNKPGHVGLIYTVTRMKSSKWHCSHCNSEESELLVAGVGHMNGYEMSRLKRIPPLEELEGEKTEKDLREPA